MPVYLREILARLNALFGDTAPLLDQAAMVNQITEILRNNPTVMAQVEQNTKDVALKGNLPGAVQGAVVRSMSSHQDLAKLLLTADKQALPVLNLLIYDLLKSGQMINLEALRG
jgi:type I restriction enzyme R subunit